MSLMKKAITCNFDYLTSDIEVYPFDGNWL